MSQIGCAIDHYEYDNPLVSFDDIVVFDGDRNKFGALGNSMTFNAGQPLALSEPTQVEATDDGICDGD